MLPKSADAEYLYDYPSPISLINLIANIFFPKALSLWLAPLLGDMVSANQSAFIAEHSIHDNFQLVKHTARLIHNLKVSPMMLKIDIARAFDSVSWLFLLHILSHLGFGPCWREWIFILLSTTSTHVLVNGMPGHPISHTRGLRQSDPLSPMLFTLDIDVLNALIQRAACRGLLCRLTPSHAASRISLYVDDVVTFCHPDAHDIATIKVLLHVFGIASSLRTNLAKCFATPIGCSEEHEDTI